MKISFEISTQERVEFKIETLCHHCDNNIESFNDGFFCYTIDPRDRSVKWLRFYHYTCFEGFENYMKGTKSVGNIYMSDTLRNLPAFVIMQMEEEEPYE